MASHFAHELATKLRLNEQDANSLAIALTTIDDANKRRIGTRRDSQARSVGELPAMSEIQAITDRNERENGTYTAIK